MAGIRRNVCSPAMSRGGGADDGSEFSSFTTDMQRENELICDECHCPKRHDLMIWYWDEQCTINICEHCAMSNHRQHSLKPQDEAEMEEMESYEKFLLGNQSLTESIFTDIVKQREMLKLVGTNLSEMKGLGEPLKQFIEKYESKLKGIEKEIVSVKGLRLTSVTYWKRNGIRHTTKQIVENIADAMKDLCSRLDKLFYQFDQVKMILSKWEREGLTTSEFAETDQE